MAWNAFVHPLKEKNAYIWWVALKNDRNRWLRAMDSITSMGRGSVTDGLLEPTDRQTWTCYFFFSFFTRGPCSTCRVEFWRAAISDLWDFFWMNCFCSLEKSIVMRENLQAMLRYLAPYASVVVWVLFNEGWGQSNTQAWICHRVCRDFENWTVTQEFLRSREELAIPFFSGMEWDW